MNIKYLKAILYTKIQHSFGLAIDTVEILSVILSLCKCHAKIEVLHIFRISDNKEKRTTTFKLASLCLNCLVYIRRE